MHKALPIDREALRAAYLKGLPLCDLAKQFNVNENTIRSWASRGKWQRSAQQAAQIVQLHAIDAMVAQSNRHLAKMGTLAERAIDVLNDKPLSNMQFAELEQLARVADTFDKIARRTYGLDQAANQARPVLAVNVTINQDTKQHAQERIIDVESVALGAPELSEADDNEQRS
jgi:hypothetical protein